MLIVDLVIVAIILLCVGLGYKRGLTGCLLKIISFILAIIVACIFFKPVSILIINNTQIDENLENSIRSVIIKQEEEKNEVEKTEEDTTMPTVVQEYINETLEDATNDVKNKVADTTANKVATLIINAGVWITIFIIAKILLLVIKLITKWITKLPVIKQFDKLGGIIYGLLEALIIIYIILAIISFLSPMLPNSILILSIKKSFIGSFMYNSNLFLKIIF